MIFSLTLETLGVELLCTLPALRVITMMAWCCGDAYDGGLDCSEGHYYSDDADGEYNDCFGDDHDDFVGMLVR